MFRRHNATAAATNVLGLSLSIGEKILLALALATAPLALMTWRLAETYTPAIMAAENERAGLRYLQAIGAAQRGVAAFVHDGGIRIDSSVLGDVSRVLQNAESRYGEAFDTTELSAQILQRLVSRSRAEAIEAEGLLKELARQVSERSGLAADGAGDARVFRDLALDWAPALRTELTAVAAQIEAAGSRRLSDAEAGDVLRAVGALEASLRPFDALATAAAADPDLQSLSESIRDARRSASLLTQSLLGQARAGRLDPARWGPHLRNALTALASLEREARTGLGRRIDARSDRVRSEQFGALLFGGFWLVGAFGATLFVLHRTVVRPVRRLVDTTASLVGGDYEVDIRQQERGDEVGSIARFLEMFRDMARSRTTAEVARQTAENASLAKSQFIANMSHELRTPLNAVIGYAEILLEEAEERPHASEVADLNRILAAARHLLSLMNDILDVSKIEAGRMKLAVEEVDPNMVADDVADAVRPLVEKNGSTLALVLPDAAGNNFRTDPLKLRQCLMNLLSNAAKFTKNGQIKLTVEPFIWNGSPALRFVVTDTGIGMTRAQMSRLFQPFMQGDESITREYGGTGLGLMLTKHMAQLLGGDVSVVSEKERGSTFTLWVTEQGEDLPLDGRGDGPLVVVIDDERDAQVLAAAALAPLGFRVRAAHNAAQGLELVRTACEGSGAALILLDINLPDRTGWSVLASLKADKMTADIPVVVCSVHADRRASAELGAADHLVKPVGQDVLAAAVLRLSRRPLGLDEFVNTGQGADHSRAG